MRMNKANLLALQTDSKPYPSPFAPGWPFFHMSAHHAAHTPSSGPLGKAGQPQSVGWQLPDPTSMTKGGCLGRDTEYATVGSK